LGKFILNENGCRIYTADGNSKKRKKKNRFKQKKKKHFKKAIIEKEILPENLVFLNDPKYKEKEGDEHKILESVSKDFFIQNFAVDIINDHCAYPGIYVAADFLVKRDGHKHNDKKRLGSRYYLIECLSTYHITPEIIAKKLQLNKEDKLIFVVSNNHKCKQLMRGIKKVVFVDVNYDTNSGAIAYVKLPGYINPKLSRLEYQSRQNFYNEIQELDREYDAIIRH